MDNGQDGNAVRKCSGGSWRADTEGDALDSLGAVSHRVPGEHIWRGVLYNSSMPPSTLEELRSFEVRDDDHIICGYPKSGTTWLQEIVYLILHDGESTLCHKTPNYARVPLLEDRRTVELCRKQPTPRIYKTHLRFSHLPEEICRKSPKIINISRNPKDVAVSYFFFYKSLAELGNYTGSWEEFLWMFTSGHVVSGCWFDYVRDWWYQKDRENVLFLQYEEILANPWLQVKKIAEFCGKKLHEDAVAKIVQQCSFESMRKNPMTNYSTARHINQTISPFLRNGKVGDWKNYFTCVQNEEFRQLYQEKIKGIAWSWRYE